MPGLEGSAPELYIIVLLCLQAHYAHISFVIGVTMNNSSTFYNAFNMYRWALVGVIPWKQIACYITKGTLQNRCGIIQIVSRTDASCV